MFIPLNSIDDHDWPNILVAGDTAAVFYLLGVLSSLKLNVFIADTGVAGLSLPGFRKGRGGRKDVAGAYYDFFEAPCRIGAGVIRRFDLLLYTTRDKYFQSWARLLRVPSACLQFTGGGEITVEIEGAIPDSGSLSGCRDIESALGEVLLALVSASAYGRYRCVSVPVTVDAQGRVHVSAPAATKLPPMVVPIETRFSSWDRTSEIFGPGEKGVIQVDGETPLTISSGEGDARLIELGVPELHIVRHRTTYERYIELTGDLVNVFDGKF